MNKTAMRKLVNTWDVANHMDNELCKMGYNATPYFTIAGEIMDAIYYMLNENTSTIDESITYTTLTNEKLTPDQRADSLVSAYECANSDLSGNVLAAIQESASMIGISTEKMVKIILCEWALQRDMMINHVKQKA